MAALGATILGMACLFYAYCLVYFGREIRSQNRLTCYGLSGPSYRGGEVSPGMRGNVVPLRALKVATARGEAGSQITPLERVAHANMILTLGKSRLTVLPARTARLAEKQAAKGSS